MHSHDLEAENEQLRVGMHEILDSIRQQDGRSDVAVASETLERLVAIMDNRRVFGTYHPDMTIKNRLEKMEGANAGKENLNV